MNRVEYFTTKSTYTIFEVLHFGTCTQPLKMCTIVDFDLTGINQLKICQQLKIIILASIYLKEQTHIHPRKIKIWRLKEISKKDNVIRGSF